MTCLATLMGFLGAVSAILDLVSHFRVQYFCIPIAVALLLFGTKRRRFATLFAALAIVNGAAIAPLFVGPSVHVVESDRVFRIFIANVNRKFGDAVAVLRAVDATNPDFVVLAEVDTDWLARLKSLDASYPYSVAEPRPDNFGIVLYSKLAFSRTEGIPLGQPAIPSLVANLTVDGKPIRLVGTHILPPVGLQYIDWQAQQRAELINLLKAELTPVLLVGDLNMTPWSAHFRDLLTKANLRDAGAGQGLQPTWPVQFPPLLIPLDRCLYSDGIEVVATRVGEQVGSDHYPLTVDFVVRDRQAL
jgi:endonuclease/exonuclease/phosphatase (EEP) superfamily protein YafD